MLQVESGCPASKTKISYKITYFHLSIILVLLGVHSNLNSSQHYPELLVTVT